MGHNDPINIPEPKLARMFFGDTRFAWIWLVLRVYLGWEWIHAGWEKIGGPGWVGAHAGTTLGIFLHSSALAAEGTQTAVSSWYWFFINNVALPHVVFFSYLVSYGELLVGIGLILGAFTGIAAAFGAFMNFNYLLAGVVSVNPLFMVVELLLILAWRNAGWIGADRFLLPKIGTPWYPGSFFRKSSRVE